MIYVLPGMGANSKMYTSYKPWLELADTNFLNWPEWNGERDLAELALAMIHSNKISSGQIIVGSSLGGMVALEIAKITNAEKVILIGSAESHSEINSLLLFLSPLINITPIKLIQLFTGKSNSQFLDMFRSVDAEFIRHMCLALKSWKGKENLENIHRIHGAKDRVISPGQGSRIVPEGGHLIAMTHPEECVTFINELLST